MQAIDPQTLHFVDQPQPMPKAGEILIRVAAAGMNRADLLQRQGRHPPPVGASHVLGLEVAGHVEALGADVTDWQVGQAVCALLEGGGYAEYAAVRASQCLPVPKGWSLIEAGGLPEAAFTVWRNLFHEAQLQAGETVLIHGGSSGIGTMAIQMARAFGATVLATAGTTEKCQLCRDLGAAKAVNYKTSDFVAELGEGSVDVILDMVGGDYLQRNLQCLRPNGRLQLIAYMGGRQAEIDLALALRKNLTFRATILRGQSAAFKAMLAKALHEQVWPKIEAGEIKPVVDRVFPLAEAEAAHAYFEEGVHSGKVVLEI